jgi:hypothetical protein
MGAYLSVDEARQVLYARFEGVLNDEVLLSRYRQALEWNDAHRYLLAIADFSGIASLSVTSRGIKQIAALDPVIPKDDLRVAIIVAPQDFIFGLARMFEMLGSKTREKVHVVRSIAEAYKLLGVESLDLQPVLE